MRCYHQWWDDGKQKGQFSGERGVVSSCVEKEAHPFESLNAIDEGELHFHKGEGVEITSRSPPGVGIHESQNWFSWMGSHQAKRWDFVIMNNNTGSWLFITQARRHGKSTSDKGQACTRSF
jgi:hypothetical protein